MSKETGEVKEGSVASGTNVQVGDNRSKQALMEAKARATELGKKNKVFITFVLVLAVIAGALYYYRGVFVAATVNGSPISRWSVVNELEKKAGKSILDTMITKKLIADEMKKSGVVVKNEDIDAEMKKIEDQVAAQGLTLEDALSGQGMTQEELREQIVINKQLEQILAEKVAVSDEEVAKYLSENKTLIPKGTSSTDMENQAREQLKGQKFNTEAEKWVSDLRTSAEINYFTQY